MPVQDLEALFDVEIMETETAPAEGEEGFITLHCPTTFTIC
ncbi:hypothetical protein ACFXDH_47890 [Streptomyces sp. NPDC059467]